MTPEIKSALHKEQTDDIFRAIGRFSVQFEHMVFFIRAGIRMMLSTNGLKNQQLANIIVADLTAMPLLGIFNSMVIEILKPEDEDKKIIKSIIKKTISMIEIRNDIIHSTWFVGPASEEGTEFGIANGHKLKKSSKVIDMKSFHYRSEDFDNISSKCRQIEDLICRLFAVAIGDREISKNFSISKEGEVSII